MINLMTLCKTTKEGFENKLGQFIWSKLANKLHWLWVMCVSAKAFGWGFTLHQGLSQLN